MKALKSALASFIATIVLSASGIALAADDDVVEPADTSVVTTDTRDNDGTGGTDDAVEGNSDVSDDSQPSVSDDSQPSVSDDSQPAISDDNTSSDNTSGNNTSGGNTPSNSTSDDSDSVDDYTQAVTTGECVTRDTATFSRVVCPDTAKSATKDDVNDAPVAPKPTAATSNARTQNSSAAPAPRAQSLSLPVTGAVVGAVTVSGNPEVEKPKLPVTGVAKGTTVTGVDKTAKGGSQNAASATLVTDNALINASSRASLFALVACAMFIVVGAGSVVSVRRLNH